MNELDFHQAINPYGPSPRVAEAMAEYARSRDYRRYGDIDGRDLQERLAALHGLSTDSFLAYNGSGEAFVWLCVAHLLLPRGRILAPYPSYERFIAVAERAAERVVSVPLEGQTFELDPDRVVDAARKNRVTVGLLSNPNNPTGNLLLDATGLARLLDELPECLWIVDEAYAEFAGTSCLSWVRERTNLIVLRTFSKAYGLAGLRIGYVATHESRIGQLAAFHLPWHVSSMSLVAAEAALEDQAYLEETVARVLADREDLSARLEATPGFRPYPSDANFLLVGLEGIDPEALASHLSAHRIQVRTRPDMPAFIRVTPLLPEQNDRLCTVLGQAAEVGTLPSSARGT